MDECKFCGAQLEENSSVCPACGADLTAPAVDVMPDTEAEATAACTSSEAENQTVPTAPEAGAEPVDTQPSGEQNVEKKKPGAAKIAAAVIALVLVGAMLIGFMTMGIGAKKNEEAALPTSAEETVPATIPADGNPDDVTCKGSYTASDADVIAQRDVVVAVCGDAELTMGQLQVAYWMEVKNFLNTYGTYAAYYGLDYTQPLDTQVCPVSDRQMTWQQFFLDAALNSWLQYTAMTNEAKEEGFQPSQEVMDYLANLDEDLTQTAVANGFESAEEMVHKNLSNAAELQDYADFVTNYYWSYEYFGSLADSFRPSDADLEGFFAEHEADYAENGITRESCSVDVRHILVYPEGADSATVRTETFSEEAWAAGKAKAEEILTAWQTGEATEDSFAQLAQVHSGDPGSASNGGLYTGVEEGQMVQNFNDWCFDPQRAIGDTGIVETEFGYHIMYFSGKTLLWRDYAESDYVKEKSNAKVDEICGKYTMDVDFGKILLAVAEM